MLRRPQPERRADRGTVGLLGCVDSPEAQHGVQRARSWPYRRAGAPPASCRAWGPPRDSAAGSAPLVPPSRETPVSRREDVSETFLARQGIFNRSLSVVGYELFFRSGSENFFCGHDGDEASLRVIESSLNTFGLGGLAAGGRVFINVTRRMLVEGYTSLLPPKSSVIEILGSVKPEPEVVDACIAQGLENL